MFFKNNKVKDFLNFEEIKTVIDIDSDLKADGGKHLVEKYVISQNIKGHLEKIAQNLSNTSHKSLQIIGSYGSGKSHLLAFLISLLENKNNIDYIQNVEIREIFKKKLTRNFLTVQFELHSNKKDLGEIFFYQIKSQLKSKYGIEIPSKKYEDIMEPKEEIDNILKIIKEKNSETGLVIIMDEISDFMKGKNSKSDKVRDTQFMRTMAQKSQDCDFMLIGAMQEQVFTNSDFIDDADSLGRIYERFDVITISREDIKTVVSSRILSKNQQQQDDLDNFFDDFANKIPAVRNKIDDYIKLYPVHPYVIEIFNELPVFETRGILTFVTDNVQKILEKPINTFITFDKIYDQIAETHTMKHLDEIAPIVDAVGILSNKVDFLRSDMKEEALKIIKSLAILRLHGKTTNNGATAEEIASNLMIFSENLNPVDRVKIILKNLRDQTDGQYIQDKEGYYYIDVENQIDYKLVIERKAENLPNGAENEELLKLICEKFNLPENNIGTRVLEDTCTWIEKNSFRKGCFAFDDGENAINLLEGDFNFIVRSSIAKKNKISSNSKTAILRLKQNDEIYGLLKRISATFHLMKDGKYAKQIMQTNNQNYKKEFEKKLLSILLESDCEINGVIRPVKGIITSEPSGIAEFYELLKKTIFQEHFNQTFNKYPKFSIKLSQESLKNEMDRSIKNISKNGMLVATSNDKSYLRGLGLINISGEITIENSLFATTILNYIKKKSNMNIQLEDIKEMFLKEPFGLDDELINLIIFFLTFNGIITMVKQGGGDISSSELLETFGKEGYKYFTHIKYIKQESDVSIVDLKKTFKILGINEVLLNNKNSRIEAVQEFRNISLGISQDRDSVISDLVKLEKNINVFPESRNITQKLEYLRNYKINFLLSVTNPTSLKSAVLSDNELMKLDEFLKLLKAIKEFFTDFNSNLEKDYLYMKNSYVLLEEQYFDSEVHTFDNEFKKCKEIMEQFDTVLNSEERRQLRGKLQQYKEKYSNYYYKNHEEKIGTLVKWNKLEDVVNSLNYKELSQMKLIRGVNKNSFTEIEEKLSSLTSYKCNQLKIEELKESIYCPHCTYPRGNKNFYNINNEILEIENKVISMVKEWKNRIMDDVISYKSNIDLLENPNREIISNVLQQGKIENISHDLVKALNSLFIDIEEKEISLIEISNVLFADGEILTYKEFEEKLENLKRYVKTNITVIDNLRIKKN